MGNSLNGPTNEELLKSAITIMGEKNAKFRQVNPNVRDAAATVLDKSWKEAGKCRIKES